MDIKLPKKQDSDGETIDSKRIVVIGANGSGKTRFGTDIEQRYNKITHRISAQKSLSMPKEVSPKSILRAESELLYGHYSESYQNDQSDFKTGERWGQNPNTFLLNDYEKLMVLLHTNEYETSISFKESYVPGQTIEKPITKLNIIQRIWESVLPHRKIEITSGSINAYSLDGDIARYNASEMSDGERIVFYLIGEVISVPVNSIIIIDEPEMHIHSSITNKLWDKIEQERPDCTFIYLTHDINFATSRQDSIKVWAKGYNGSVWDYEIIDSESELPDLLLLEILGSRKPILFIEGDSSSIDYKLLQLVFIDYTIKPLGGCNKVFESTRSFREHMGFHNIETFGLIDRDRRTDEEITHIKNPFIWVAKVAEIENFLLVEDVVRSVAIEMKKNPDEIISNVKNNVFAFFHEQIGKQALEHTISRIERVFKISTNNAKVKTFDEFESDINTFLAGQNFRGIYNEILQLFQTFIETQNYTDILKVFNNKGLLIKSDVAALCDLNPRNDAYLKFIQGILKQNSPTATSIRDAIIQNIEK